jgi:small subunit ribosomal protein S1
MLDESASSEMAELLEQALPPKAVRKGAVIEGVVISMDSDGIMVDVGLKTEGIVPPEEMRSLAPEEKENLNPGDKLFVMLLGDEGQAGMSVLSVDRAQEERKWRELGQTMEEGSDLTGRIVGHNRGGLEVDFKGIRGFVPFSQAAPIPRDEDNEKAIEARIGQEAQFNVLEMNRARGRLVLSERAIWQRRRDETQERAIAKLEEGTTIKGKVASIRGFGAFISLGDVDGLIPFTELSWGRVKAISDVLKVGQEVDVYVMRVDKESKKVTLSLRRTQPEPWETVGERYHAGQRVHGTAIRIADFGVFVQLEEGIDGLIHISELSWTQVRSSNEILQVGDVVEVEVLRVDEANRRISLSYRRTQPEPWDTVPERYKVGEIAQGTVTRLAEFGAFVELEDTVEGLIHISELSHRQVSDPGECVYVKQKVPVKILEVDPTARRISLSYKQAFDPK